MKLTEDVLVASWPKDKNPPKVPFPRMNYQYAIRNYGSDKPCVLDKLLVSFYNVVDSFSRANTSTI